MQLLEWALDSQKHLSGRILSVILSIVLVFSFSAFTPTAFAETIDPETGEVVDATTLVDEEAVRAMNIEEPSIPVADPSAPANNAGDVTATAEEGEGEGSEGETEAPVIPAEGTLSVTYELAGGVGDQFKDDTLYTAGQEVQIVSGAPEREGYIFTGWMLHNELIEGTSFTMPSTDAVLVAQWEPTAPIETKTLSYTVEFYLNGTLAEDGSVPFEVAGVPVDDPDIVNVDEFSIDMDNRFNGYVVDIITIISPDGTTEVVSELPSSVEHGATIRIDYKANTKDDSYCVEYYRDGIQVEEDFQVFKFAGLPWDNELLDVDKSKINIVDKYEGYELEAIYVGDEQVDAIPAQVKGGTTICVYYAQPVKQLSYSVQYTLDGEFMIEDSFDRTQTVGLDHPDTITVDASEIELEGKYYGYTVGSITVDGVAVDALPAEVASGTAICINYVVDESLTKELSYTVEFAREGQVVTEDTLHGSATVQVLQSDDLMLDRDAINTVDKYPGYVLGSIVVNGYEVDALPETVTNGSVVRVNYVLDQTQTKDLSYTVEYTRDGQLVADDTQLGTATVPFASPDVLSVDVDSINTINKYMGYKLGSIQVNGQTVSALPAQVDDGSTIRVNYVADESQTKELVYSVEYFRDGTLIPADTQTVVGNVQVLQPNMLPVDATNINTTDKYLGYKLDYIAVDGKRVDALPTEVEGSSTIRVYYTLDEAQTKELSYTVEYYRQNQLVAEDTQHTTAAVHVLQSDVLSVDAASINTTDKYLGYALESIRVNGQPVDALPATVPDGSTITVNYIVDPTQTKQLTYKVEFTRDGEFVTEDTFNFSTTVHVTESDMLNVDLSQVDFFNKYNGYMRASIQVNEEFVSAVPTQVASGSTIRVNYITDPEQTKELNYYVQYYRDGVQIDQDAQVGSAIVQVLQPDMLRVDASSINTTDKYYGYRLDALYVNGEQVVDLPAEVANGSVIQVAYEIDPAQTKDLSYTVEYTRDGQVVAEDTLYGNATVQVLQPDTLAVNTNEIDTTDNKYYGYRLDSIQVNGQSVSALPTEVDNGSTIRVNYAVDQAQTKELSYTVDYFRDGMPIAEDAQRATTTVQVLQPDVLSVEA